MICILNCSRYTSIKDMLSRLNWLSVNKLIELNVLTFIFKIVNNMGPQYFVNSVKRNEEIHNFN